MDAKSISKNGWDIDLTTSDVDTAYNILNNQIYTIPYLYQFGVNRKLIENEGFKLNGDIYNFSLTTLGDLLRALLTKHGLNHIVTVKKSNIRGEVEIIVEKNKG
jgi:hypothetical protein